MRVTSLFLVAASTLALASNLDTASMLGEMSSFSELGSEAMDDAASGFEKRSLCISLPGLKIGINCGGWNEESWNLYQGQCRSLGWKPQSKVSGSVTLLLWGKTWIPHTEWQTYGDYWLPKDVNSWGCQSPEPFFATDITSTAEFGYYQNVMGHLKESSHYYYDSARSGFWFMFKGSFHFESEFIVSVKNGQSYYVPQQYSDSYY